MPRHPELCLVPLIDRLARRSLLGRSEAPGSAAGASKRAVLTDLAVLAVTAYAGKGDEERIRDAGAADYLAKPVSIGPFMTAVRTLLPA